ncbi:hypothetical protein CEXT_619121 [Caerostris extrusa]|uniref:Uncharacterized protein n=1 Tax=Caerostris extrusa TaxID=172846 RepID=A0AAV4XP84_CAEEX|nr:hypothetical protein CEXT_619121 [Caerostris extrusa]
MKSPWNGGFMGSQTNSMVVKWGRFHGSNRRSAAKNGSGVERKDRGVRHDIWREFLPILTMMSKVTTMSRSLSRPQLYRNACLKGCDSDACDVAVRDEHSRYPFKTQWMYTGMTSITGCIVVRYSSNWTFTKRHNRRISAPRSDETKFREVLKEIVGAKWWYYLFLVEEEEEDGKRQTPEHQRKFSTLFAKC